MSIRLETEGFDIEKVLDEVETYGAASVHILSEERRNLQLGEAKVLIGSRVLPKDPPTCVQVFSKQVNVGRLFLDFRDSFQDFLAEKLATLKIYPLSGLLNFDQIEIIGFNARSDGFGIHHDDGINLHCIFMLGGMVRFFVCTDYRGSDPREIDTTPGNVIIMRAPGFRNTEKTQLHYVNGIETETYISVLRQRP